MTDLTLSTPGVAGDERPPGPRRSVRVPYLIGAAALALATALIVLWGFSAPLIARRCWSCAYRWQREHRSRRALCRRRWLASTRALVGSIRRAPTCPVWSPRPTCSRVTCCRRRWSRLRRRYLRVA